MTVEIPAKEETAQPQIVGVIMSADDLRRALTMKSPPDWFELRLDAFVPHEKSLIGLRAPLIITARDPREGGAGGLALTRRRELLQRFLPHARRVDVELRNAAAFTDVLASNLSIILSLHDFTGTPSLASLRKKLRRAKQLHADILKIATVVDNAAQLDRLLAFFDEAKSIMPVAAMGMGKLGRESRIALVRRGSTLNYSGIRAVPDLGQLSIAELRRRLRHRV